MKPEKEEETRQKFVEVASILIDSVEDAIRNAYPEIEKIVPKEDEDGNFVNTLLYGIPYYDLEDYVIETLQNFVNGEDV